MKSDFELKEQALQALCFTRDYVGAELLPPITGWSWYDSGLDLAESIPESIWAKEFWARVNQPSNEVDAIDTKPCPVVALHKHYRQQYQHNFCPSCGRALSE